MAETIVSMQNVAAKKIELHRTLERMLGDVDRKLARYRNTGKNGISSYDVFLDVLSCQSAVEQCLSASLPFLDKAMKSSIFSFYTGALVGLDAVSEKQEDEARTAQFFGRQSLNFDKGARQLHLQLLDVYGRVIDVCTDERKIDLEEMTAQYFGWIRDESLKYADEKRMIELDSYLRKNPVVIKTKHGDKRFNSFGIVRDEDRTEYSWNLIGGYDALKEECKEIALAIKHHDFMKRRQQNPLPTGILFYGPPGTGKTTLAKIIAHEAGVPFETLDRTTIASTYKDGSVEQITKTFRRLKNYPLVILFIDEVDSIAAVRGEHREDDKVVNTLLTNMDSRVNPNIIYIGATNRPDILDPALKRPGRFTKMMLVDYPHDADREKIFKSVLDARRTYALQHNNEQMFHSNMDFCALGRESEKFTGDDIRAVIDAAIWRQSMEHIKHQRQIVPLTAQYLLDELRNYRTRKVHNENEQRSYV